MLGLLTVGVGGVAASHGEPVDDREIVEIQTVSDDSEQGMVSVELRYHIGSEIAGLRTQIQTADAEVVETDGFSPVDSDGEYEWDQQTAEPTIAVRVPINETAGDAYDYVDAGDWLMTDRPLSLRTGWTTVGFDPDKVEVRRLTQAGEDGVAADGMVYLGGYDSYEFGAAGEQFELVMTQPTDPEWTVAEIRERLVGAAERFDVSGRSERITVFVVADPLRRGGLSTSTNAAVWVHEGGLQTPQTTLFHEYVHTRQDYDRATAVDWTIEGSADYYGKLLALKDGSIEYHRFHQLLARGNEYDDAVLADPDTWAGTRASYRLGALTIAALDERLRAAGSSYTAVFRAKNAADEQITDSSFESLARERGDIGDFFDRHIRSTPPEITVPAPTIYNGSNNGAALDLQVPELTLKPGETERVTVTLANTGTEQSLAPQLSADSSDLVNVSLVESDGSGVTETDEGWVFDHLPAGERYELTMTVNAEQRDDEQIRFAAEDLSDQRAEATVTLDAAEPLVASLDLPTAGTTGEAVNATATTTPEDANVTGYMFQITGPSEQIINSTDPTLMFTPADAGMYTVSVTATAADGRTAIAEQTVDVSPADSGGTDDTEEDGTNTTDDTDDGGSEDTTTDSTDDEAVDTGEESADGSGDGFGPAVVVGALVALTLLARRRTH